MNQIEIFFLGAAVGIVFIGGMFWLAHILRKRPLPPIPLTSQTSNSSFPEHLGVEEPELVFVHAKLSAPHTIQQRHAWDKLSPRQKQVAVCVASGKSSPQAAEELRIQPSTVRGYLKEIYAALDLHTRTELANFVRDIVLEDSPPR